MTNEILKIEWCGGHASIYMPNFFPCKASKFKGLKSLIAMDDRRDELMGQVKEYFKYAVNLWDEIYQRQGKDYWHYMQKAAEWSYKLKDGTGASGCPLTKEQLKTYKQFKRECTSFANSAKRMALRAKKEKEWFKNQIQKEGWNDVE